MYKPDRHARFLVGKFKGTCQVADVLTLSRAATVVLAGVIRSNIFFACFVSCCMEWIFETKNTGSSQLARERESSLW